MPLIILAIAVVVLLILMTKFQLNGFIALLVVSIGVALAMGIPVNKIPASLESGFGGQAGTFIVIGLGAMTGLILGDGGAAQRISTAIIDRFGDRSVQVAMVVTSIVIGVTMFYEAAFVIVVPIAFALVRSTKKPLLWVGLPMSITLSTMHSFLPPHPGPTTVVNAFHASLGLTFVYGLIIAIPVGVLIALVWPRLPFIRKMNPQIPEGLASDKVFTAEELPSLAKSLTVALLPVVLIAGPAIAMMILPKDSPSVPFLSFIGNADVALLIALLVAIIVFGPGSHRPLKAVMGSCASAARAMAMIILVIGAGGAFKQVLVDGGVAKYITKVTSGWHISALLLAWLIAVILRVALGSATVAVVTAAGVVAPMLATSGYPPELMVLAVTCGSIAFSHVNDPGFWMFKEYFNLSVPQALASRTTYTTVLSILGLGGVMLLSLVVH